MSGLQPAIFLDRDGVINIDHGYVHKPEYFQFIGGVFRACRLFREMGYKLIIITNQAGIARGYYDIPQFHRLTDWMLEQFRSEDIEIDGVYFCPHHPEKGVGEYLQQCKCRKPEPGMLLKAAEEHPIDLSASILIGDRCSDIEAGYHAGLKRCFMVKTGKPISECASLQDGDRLFDLLEAAKRLKKDIDDET